MKFITPVSMPVTSVEEIKMLKESLKGLGYNVDSVNEIEENDFIATNYLKYHNVAVTFNGTNSFIPQTIKHNPDLFLALAAMNDSKEPIVGECIIERVLYTDIPSALRKFDGVKSGRFTRKATKEEIVEHFVSLKETLKEWCFKIDKSNLQMAEFFRRKSIKFTENWAELTERYLGWYMCPNGAISSNPIGEEMSYANFLMIINPKILEEFNSSKIPEKWYLKINEDNAELVARWRSEKYNYNINKDSILRDFKNVNFAGILGLYNRESIAEITTEQFKRYVMNTPTENEKKIVGYNLKDRFKNLEPAICKIIYTGTGSKDKNSFYPDRENCLFEIDTVCYNNAREAGVLDLWFEPVYEEKYGVGDYVLVKGCKHAAEGNGILNDCIGRLKDKGFGNTGCFLSESDFSIDIKKENIFIEKANSFPLIKKSHIIRLATEKEIQEFESKSVTKNFGSNNETILIEDGIFKSGRVNINVNSLKECLKDFVKELEIKNYVGIFPVRLQFLADRDTRFIRIGCERENHLFSINELEEAISIAESQLPK